MAYNVFLVEDEIVVREGIRNRINWSSTNFNLCGEAPDGEMALSMMHDLKPDILITDIKMPFLDGFELSKIIRKSMPWIKIIILSGYDEFDFAKEAISIGVEEYLVKPVDAAELLKTLEKVAAVIEKEYDERKNIEMLTAQAESLLDIKREKIFTNLIMGLTDISSAIEFTRSIGIDILAKYYLIIIIEMEVEDYNYKEFLKAKKFVDFILKERDDVVLVSMSVNKYILILKSFDNNKIEDTAYEISNAIKYEVERQTNCLLRIFIGSIVERLRKIPSSYAESDKAIKYMNMFGIQKIVSSKDVYNEGSIPWIQNARLTDKIKHANHSDIPKLVDDYLKNVEEENTSLLMSHYILTEVLIFCTRLVSSLGGLPQEIFPETNNLFAILSNITTKKKLSDTIQKLLQRTFDYRDSCNGLKYGDIIRSAKEFIENHYNEADISLKTVSAMVSLSPNHFSAIFSQEMGETFIEYLTKVRVQKSKKLLLTTTMRSADIAYAIGYQEPHYFSYIFKKHTGITPREYRTKNSED